MGSSEAEPHPDCDVLVVGAGPTGLALAAQLRRFGASVRLIDAAEEPSTESKALAIQPRTLEVLRPFGVSADLVKRGNPAVRVRLHTGRHTADAQLFDIGIGDTHYPYLLFLSQAETEQVLGEHLRHRGLVIERPVRLLRIEAEDADGVTCLVRGADGTAQRIRSRYLVGCDGAHSEVRQQTGIPFTGAAYPQRFLLADLEADLEPGMVHVFFTPDGPLVFFPLGRPAPWRLITVRREAAPPGAAGPSSAAAPGAADEQPLDGEPARRPELPEIQAAVDAATGGRVRLGSPVWATAFRVHHRQAERYRQGRVFLAGDAAHIHSPVGAQGMNTGIQDAINLGWKLALVVRGAAVPELLDTYQAERHPVGEYVLRFTDRAFTAAASTNPLVRAMRTHLAPRVLPLALRVPAAQAAIFRTVSQLGIRYRHSPAVANGNRRFRGPGPGDRLPDLAVRVNGSWTTLHQLTAAPAFHLVIAGPAGGDSAIDQQLPELHARFAERLIVHHVDSEGGLLPAPPGAHLVVRPDGHLGYRQDAPDLSGAQAYLERWLTSTDGPRAGFIESS